MARTVTFDHIAVRSLTIYPVRDGWLSRVDYDICEADNSVVASKSTTITTTDAVSEKEAPVLSVATSDAAVEERASQVDVAALHTGLTDFVGTLAAQVAALEGI
jgi:hypothetical protein